MDPEIYDINTVSVAIEVLRNVVKENSVNFPGQGNSPQLTYMADMLEQYNIQSLNPPLCIKSTCSYTTYIWIDHKFPDQDGDSFTETKFPIIRISTCHNHNWNDQIKKQHWKECGYGADMGDEPTIECIPVEDNMTSICELLRSAAIPPKSRVEMLLEELFEGK